MAAPAKFNPDYHIPWAWSLAIRGATDQEIAGEFGVSERTVNRWKYVYKKVEVLVMGKDGKPALDENGYAVTKEEVQVVLDDDGEKVLSEFGKALQVGKKAADAKVERKLYERCLGYSYTEEEKILEYNTDGSVKPVKVRTVKKEVPPDVMAQMYWLNNRSRKTGEWSQRQDVMLRTSTEADLSNLSEEELRKLASLAPPSE